MKPRIKIIPALLLAALLAASCAGKKLSPELKDGPGYTKVNNNLHQLDGPPPGEPAQAFRLYRSGAPSQETFAKWCSEYGIERVIVLAGTAEKYEFAYQSQGVCPGIQVIYNVHQTVGEPVSDKFLQWFDSQIAAARRDHVGLLLRCQTGSHRAGRLSAYYQMKDQGLSAEDAVGVMNYNGLLMPLFDPALVPQVEAMDDYIHDRPCAQKEKACVQMNSDAYLPRP